MDEYIAYTIRGNKEGSEGFGVIKERLYEERFIYVIDVTRTFDNRPTYSILINDDYTIFVCNNSNVSSMGASRGGSLRIALAIPSGYSIKGGISPFVPLDELCNHFIGEYMDAKSDNVGSFYQFNSKSRNINGEDIEDLLRKYQLESAPFKCCKTKSRSTIEDENLGYIQVNSKDELEKLFINPYYPKFEKYSEIVVAYDFPKSVELVNVDIPRIIKYAVYINGKLSTFKFGSDRPNRKVELKSIVDEYHDPLILEVSLDDICKKTVDDIKIDYQNERIDWNPVFQMRSFKFRIQLVEGSKKISFTKLKLTINKESKSLGVSVGDDGYFQLDGETYKYIKEGKTSWEISAGPSYKTKLISSNELSQENPILIDIQPVFLYKLKVFLGNREISAEKISISDLQGNSIPITSGKFKLFKDKWNDNYKVSCGDKEYEIESIITESSENTEENRFLKVRLQKKDFQETSNNLPIVTTNSDIVPSPQSGDSKFIAILNFDNTKFSHNKVKCVIKTDDENLFETTSHITSGSKQSVLKLYNPCWLDKNVNIVISDSKMELKWSGQITSGENTVDLKKISSNKKVSNRCLAIIASVVVAIVILSCIVGIFISSGKEDEKIKEKYNAYVKYVGTIECSDDSITSIKKWLEEESSFQYNEKQENELGQKCEVVSEFLKKLNTIFDRSQMGSLAAYYNEKKGKFSDTQKKLIEVFVAGEDSLYEEARLAALGEVMKSLKNRKMLIGDLTNVTTSTDVIYKGKKCEQDKVLKEQREKIAALELKYEELYSSLGVLKVDYQLISEVVTFLKKDGVAVIDDNQSKKLSSRKGQLVTLFSYLGGEAGENKDAKNVRLDNLKTFLSDQNNYNQLSGDQQGVLRKLKKNYDTARYVIGNCHLISEVDRKININ